MEIERVAKWTGYPITADQYGRLLELERTRIKPLPTANSDAPRGDKLQDIVTVASPPFHRHRRERNSAADQKE